MLEKNEIHKSNEIQIHKIPIRNSDLKSEKNEMGYSKSVDFSQQGGDDVTRWAVLI